MQPLVKTPKQLCGAFPSSPSGWLCPGRNPHSGCAMGPAVRFAVVPAMAGACHSGAHPEMAGGGKGRTAASWDCTGSCGQSWLSALGEENKPSQCRRKRHWPCVRWHSSLGVNTEPVHRASPSPPGHYPFPSTGRLIPWVSWANSNSGNSALPQIPRPFNWKSCSLHPASRRWMAVNQLLHFAPEGAACQWWGMHFWTYSSQGGI